MTIAAPIVSDTAWLDVGAIDDVPQRGARRVPSASGDVAIFRTGDGRLFALRDQCPHKHGPLSQGIVMGASVACPLHNWLIDLQTGQPLGADAGQGCTPVVPLMVEAGRIFIAAGSGSGL